MAEKFRYPLSELNKDDDFIQFSIIEYKRKAGSQGKFSADVVEQLVDIDPNSTTPIRFPSSIPGKQILRQSFNLDKQKNIFIGGADPNITAKVNILLPIPSQLSDSNSTKYGESTLNSFAAATLGSILDIQDSANPNQFFGKIGSNLSSLVSLANDDRMKQLVSIFTATQAINAIGGNLSVDQLFARSTGSIINPNMELLFSGPSLRNFKFQFKMAPREQKEAEECKNIIRRFKQHMSPKGGDYFITTPNVFKISYQGKSKEYLNRFKICALTDMSVNYTGEGNYATYDDGAPVSMIMDLSFTEMSPIYAEDYKEDVGGVGY